MRHLNRLLAEKYVAIGVERETASKMAEQTVIALVAADVIPQARAEAFERDAQIYYLKGQKIATSEIKSSCAVSRRTVFDAVRRHGKRRRAILRSEE